MLTREDVDRVKHRGQGNEGDQRGCSNRNRHEVEAHKIREHLIERDTPPDSVSYRTTPQEEVSAV